MQHGNLRWILFVFSYSKHKQAKVASHQKPDRHFSFEIVQDESEDASKTEYCNCKQEIIFM